MLSHLSCTVLMHKHLNAQNCKVHNQCSHDSHTLTSCFVASMKVLLSLISLLSILNLDEFLSTMRGLYGYGNNSIINWFKLNSALSKVDAIALLKL